MNTIEVSVLIALVGVFLSIVGSLKTRDRDTENKATNQAKISVKLDTICNTTNDIRADLKSMNMQIQDLNKEVVIQGQSLNTSWKKLDGHSEQIKDHEERIIRLEDTVNNN